MHRITTADQTSIYLKDWGEGSPVVLIRGWPTTAQVLRRLFCDFFSMGSSDSPFSGETLRWAHGGVPSGDAVQPQPGLARTTRSAQTQLGGTAFPIPSLPNPFTLLASKGATLKP